MNKIMGNTYASRSNRVHQFRRRLGVNSVGEANKLPGDGSRGTSRGDTTVIGRERAGGGGTRGGGGSIPSRFQELCAVYGHVTPSSQFD
jgi:hypothetical protein